MYLRFGHIKYTLVWKCVMYGWQWDFIERVMKLRYRHYIPELFKLSTDPALWLWIRVVCVERQKCTFRQTSSGSRSGPGAMEWRLQLFWVWCLPSYGCFSAWEARWAWSHQQRGIPSRLGTSCEGNPAHGDSALQGEVPWLARLLTCHQNKEWRWWWQASKNI